MRKTPLLATVLMSVSVLTSCASSNAPTTRTSAVIPPFPAAVSNCTKSAANPDLDDKDTAGEVIDELSKRHRKAVRCAIAAEGVYREARKANAE